LLLAPLLACLLVSLGYCLYLVDMGPMIADLIVLLQKNRQACFGKDVYREPRLEELLPWERVLQEQEHQQLKNTEEEDTTTTNNNNPE
jgi:hypothetical protein